MKQVHEAQPVGLPGFYVARIFTRSTGGSVPLGYP